MVRPRLASDEEILTAAAEVLAERGPHGFTVTEVAEKVGLSRAAIILRFKGTEELKSALITKLVKPFVNDFSKVQVVRGGDGLISVAEYVGSYIRSREGSAHFFAGYGANVQDRSMVELERARGAALKAAVSRAMPTVAIDHDEAVALFTAHLGGCVLAWLGADDDNARIFMRVRTQQWLKLVGIPYTEAAVVSEPAAKVRKTTAITKRAKTSTTKTASSAKRKRKA